MKQDKFSIQDWKSNHFYDLIGESYQEPSPAQMDILRAIQDMVMAGDTSILDMIKDKMEAEWGDAPESGKQGPWSRNYNDTDDIENANLEEAVSLKSMFPTVDQGEMDNYFFMDLFAALKKYFEDNEDMITNIDARDARYLAHLCGQIFKILKDRSGN